MWRTRLFTQSGRRQLPERALPRPASSAASGTSRGRRRRVLRIAEVLLDGGPQRSFRLSPRRLVICHCRSTLPIEDPVSLERGGNVAGSREERHLPVAGSEGPCSNEAKRRARNPKCRT
jgi:hypothetical protein